MLLKTIIKLSSETIKLSSQKIKLSSETIKWVHVSSWSQITGPLGPNHRRQAPFQNVLNTNLLGFNPILREDNKRSDGFWSGVRIGSQRHFTDGSKKTLSSQEKVFNLPNCLCFARMLATPLAGYWVLEGHFPQALILCAASSFTDLLDGFIARKFNSVTQLGSILDPLADKLLVATLTVTLTVVHLIPIWLTLLILTRDSLILTGAFYLRYKSIEPPITVKKFFQLSTFTTSEFNPTLISKVNTGFQLSLVAFTLAAPVFGYTQHIFLSALQWATFMTTLTSGLNYLKRLKPKPKLKNN